MTPMWITGLLLAAAIGSASPVYAAQEKAPAAAPSASAIDPVAQKKAQSLIEIILPPEQRDAMFASAVNAMMGNMLSGIMEGDSTLRDALEEAPEAKPVFAQFIDRQRELVIADLRETTPELMMAYANAYARLFTADELDQIAAFVRTPTGRKYVQRSSQILSDPDFAAWQRHITAKAQARQKVELAKFMEELAPIIAAKGAKHHGS